MRRLDVLLTPKMWEDDGVEILAFGAPNTGGPADDVKPAPGWWSD